MQRCLLTKGRTCPNADVVRRPLPKLQELAIYAETHPTAYRRVESVAEINRKLRMLDLTREDVRQAIREARDAKSLFGGQFATDYD